MYTIAGEHARGCDALKSPSGKSGKKSRKIMFKVLFFSFPDQRKTTRKSLTSMGIIE